MFSPNWDRLEREWLSPPEDDSEECSDCDGAGTIPVKCEYCEGSGTFHEDCDRCEGHGSISKSQLRREYLEAKGEYEYQAYKDRKAEGES